MDKKTKELEPQESFEIEYDDEYGSTDEDYVSVNDVVYEQKSKVKRKNANRNQYYGS